MRGSESLTTGREVEGGNPGAEDHGLEHVRHIRHTKSLRARTEVDESRTESETRVALLDPGPARSNLVCRLCRSTIAVRRPAVGFRLRGDIRR
jgi:hypothetical protein